MINDRVSISDVHQAIKMSFMFRSRFAVPVLNHSMREIDIKSGAPELKRIVLDQGWHVVGEDNIYDGRLVTNKFRSKKTDEIISHVVIEPCQKPSKLNNLIA